MLGQFPVVKIPGGYAVVYGGAPYLVHRTREAALALARELSAELAGLARFAGCR